MADMPEFWHSAIRSFWLSGRPEVGLSDILALMAFPRFWHYGNANFRVNCYGN